MRKIYPPFNKFVGFLLYGLLSIAVITLAQSIPSDPLTNCKPKLTSPLKKQVAIGYVQLNNAMEIPWDSYDYINVIAYPKADGWNNIHPPPQEQLKALSDLKVKKPPTANTQILLSVRNYDITNWPEDKDYGKIVTETINTIKTFDLDGVDIEYPGMRGSLCPKGPDNGAPLVWNKGRDAGFVKFIGNLRAQMNQNQMGKKIIMLTVGRNVIEGAAGLSNYIKYLNIETYHFSLYENLRVLQDINNNNNNVGSFPNAPYDEFTSVHDAWVKAQIGVEIIMGVDIGNTFQVVFNNPSMSTPPTLEVNFFPNPDDFFRQDPDLANIQSILPINNLCSADPLNDRLRLYSFPWKDLLKISKCKIPIPKWNYNVDDSSSTPWLYKESENFPGGPGGPGAYYYISFEDLDSLNKKLSYVTNTIGGVSISDVSYDVVGDDSLIGFIQAIRSATPSQSPNSPSSPNSPNGPNESPPKGKEGETKDGINESDGKNLKSPQIGAIVGGVFGSLVLVILGVCGFYFYRYRKLPKSSSSLRSLLKFNKGFPNSRNHAISRNPEMTSEPTLAPPTTVIPVASGYVTAMFDFTGKEENDLSFKKGDKIEVLERGDGPNDWWVGRVNGAVGEFPGNYVKET